ncbi:MAG: MATE family efflux transporter [Vallitaleaceae bacterium]|nr:MATE family efflux transporter [Vallitaleaceae bacterium]
MKRTQRLGEEKISHLLMEFSIPAIIGMLITALYNVVDRIFIGNAPNIGSLGIAGITIGMPIMVFMMAVGMLIGIGGSSLTALKLGEGDHKGAEHILGNALSSITVLVLFFSILLQIFLRPILEAFGTSSDVLPFSIEYLRIILLGTTFNGVAMCLNSFIRVDGQPKIAMSTNLIGAIANVILDPIFIFAFDMGIAGAALATILSQLLTLIWTFRYFLSNKSHLKIQVKNLRPDFPLIGRIMALGAPSFLMQLAGTFVGILLNIILNGFNNDIAISGIGIISSLQMLMIMPLIGINQGVQPLIGYNYGAKNYDRVKEALSISLKYATIIAVIGFIIVMLIPKLLVNLFNQEPELVKFTVYAARIMFLALPTVGFQIIGSSYFQAIGKPKLATLLTLSRQLLVLVPCLILFSKFFGINGVVFATPAADFLAALLTLYIFSKDVKNLKEKPEEAIA